jgi:transposase-like protein
VIDTESKLLLEIDVLSRRGTDPAAAFLHRLQEKHELDDTEFLVDAGGYLTAPHLTKIERPAQASRPKPRRKWFQTIPLWIDRSHSFPRGSPASARRWLQQYRHHHNHNRPNQALDGRTPVEQVLNYIVSIVPKYKYHQTGLGKWFY